MLHHENYFVDSDGCRLFENVWLPQSTPEAVVVFVHGFTEHGGRYEAFAEALNEHGYAVYAMDLRGHGRSAGARAWVCSSDEYLNDFCQYLDQVRKRNPDTPTFLLGHSLGGQILAWWAVKCTNDVRGMILSAPALMLDDGMFPILRRLVACVGWLFPRLRLVRMGASRLCRDPEVVARFRADPLVFHGRFPTRTGTEILRVIEQIEADMEAVRLPLLILHGTEDAVTDPEGSRRLHARAGSSDKTLKLYDGLYHDLFHEPEWKQIVADVVAWLGQRIRIPA
jgi:alpha-beta hydrolase superfamily lysophospholipase